MPAVVLRLLGGFAATVDGEPVPDAAWRLKKARELVKMLALAPGRRLHREQAMDALWRDLDPAAAANNLHQALHVVRRALGPTVVTLRDGSLRLAAELDVDRLRRAAEQARAVRTAAAYRAALALYAGELLPENRYDDWVVEHREQLAALRAALTDELAALGAAGPVPGSPAGSASGPAAASRPRHLSAPSLPHDASSFVGRGRELAELAVLLRHGRLLTLSGTGGAGKTRLALELARGAAAAFPDGVVLVELAPVAASRQVPDAVAAALDVQPLPRQSLDQALVDVLAGRRVLLLLDNCEHVLPGCAPLVDLLLRRTPWVTVLATSREPLRVPGEVVFRVPSLALPDPDQAVDPRSLSRFESVRLLTERARAAAPGFAVTAENAADLARICFRLDGLPLALELAAGRVATLDAAAVAARLDDRFRLLRGGSRVAPTRQQTLAATLQWSFDLLDEAERVLFRRLAVFAGGFDLAAVEAVCADAAPERGPLDTADVADLLARLVEKSLVVSEVPPRAGSAPYHLLETVREWARVQLDEAGETAAVQTRHAAWATALAASEGGSARLDPLAANLRVALDLLLATSAEDAMRLGVSLVPFWLRRIDLIAADRGLTQALDAVPGPTELRGRTLLAAASVNVRRGAVGRATHFARAALANAVERGDVRARWRAVQLLGEIAVVHEKSAEADDWFHRGLVIARREGLPVAEAVGVYSLAVARSIDDELAAAEELLDRATGLLRGLVGSTATVTTPVNISSIRGRVLGRPGLRLVFEETLQPFARLTCPTALAFVLVNRASVARMRGDLATARTLLDEGDDRFTRAGDRRGQADVLVRRAYLCLAEGSLPSARAYLEDALRRRRQLHDRRGVGLALTGLGLVETTAGRHPEAERHLGEAGDLFRRAADRWGLISALWRTADLSVARARPDQADQALREAQAVADQTRQERWIAHTVSARAEVALVRGDVDRAGELLADARERFARARDQVGARAAEDRLSELLSRR